MWIPSTEEEIIEAIRSRDLVETSTFDVKRQLPPPGKMSDVVIDIAAMSNDGGVLLYGVGENEGGRPADLHPFQLKGQVERVEQALRTGSAEPPEIHIKEIRTAEDPEKGYLLVVGVSLADGLPNAYLFPEDEYARSLQLSSIQLIENPKSVAAGLIMPLVNALAQGRSDPFGHA